MSVKLVCNVLLWYPTLDVFILHLFDDTDSVVANTLQWTHYTSVLNRPSWTYEGDEVGEVWNCQAKVSLGTNTPLVLSHSQYVSRGPVEGP